MLNKPIPGAPLGRERASSARPANGQVRPAQRRMIRGLAILTGIGLIGAASLFGYGYPESVVVWLAEALNAPGILPGTLPPQANLPRSRWPQDESALPPDVLRPLAAGQRAAALIRDLRKRPPIAIESASLILSGAPREEYIVTPELVLHDAAIFTNGRNLTIETENLDAANAVIRAFPQASAAAAGPGADGGRLTLIVHGAIKGELTIDLSGQAGAAGAKGQTGLRGAEGAQGPQARPGADGCAAPAGQGQRGGAGGTGGVGGDGGSGGDGGTLSIIADHPEALAGHIDFAAAGGFAGAPGSGGDGGPGGRGGLGGQPASRCFGNGPAGEAGPAGANGQIGKDGTAGRAGKIEATGPDGQTIVVPFGKKG